MEVRQQRESGVDTRALTVRVSTELAEWLRRTAFESRRSQALIVEEALVRYRESG